jgi:hypothetical protein
VRPSVLDMGAYHAALRKAWKPESLEVWALRLGVWEYALDALQPAFDAAHDALAFPMRDGEGKVTGIRLRNAEGKKWAIRGGSDGLFYNPDMAVKDELVICEGPTDTAAALSLDLPAVGRPSCLGGVEELKVLVKRLKIRQLTIVADHDTPHTKPDGAIWYPGLEGTRKLIAEVRKMARVVVPAEKDMRAWFADGGGVTREQFDALAKNATWRLS